MNPLRSVFSGLRDNRPVRFHLASILASACTYFATFFLLESIERGTITGVLYIFTLLVGASYLGSNTFIAHWDKGPFSQRLQSASHAAIPGILIGLSVAGIGTLLGLVGGLRDNPVIELAPIVGTLVILGSLAESIFSAKTSALEPQKYWQHYFYLVALMVQLVLLVFLDRLSVETLLQSYLFASLVFLIAPWRVSRVAFASGWWSHSMKPERIEAARAFVGTFVANAHIRITGLAILAVHGPSYLGDYLVLWLGFELVDTIFRTYLLTRIVSLASARRDSVLASSKKFLRKTLAFSIPLILGVAISAFALGLVILNRSSVELVWSLSFLSFAQIVRFAMHSLLNILRATKRNDLASSIYLADTALACTLAALFPIFWGFVGVAIGLAIASIVSLLVSKAVVWRLGSYRLPEDCE